MKDRKEFKYQHQLDQTGVRKSRRSPSSSGFDLICGVLLGGLAFGIVFPSVKQWMQKENAPVRMSTKASIGKKTTDFAVASQDAPAATETQPPSPPLASQALPKKGAPATDKAIALNPVSKSPAKALPAKKAAKPLEKKNLSSHSNAQAKIKGLALMKPASPKTIETTLTEAENLPSAQDIGAKIDSNLLLQELGTEPADDAAFVTIYNTQYSKEALASCRNRCLLKGKDASGAPVNAVISGPNFADILQEHQGTINLTGVRRTVKNQKIFMVQSITFNLPPQKNSAQRLPEVGSAPTVRISDAKPLPAPSASPIKSAYDDLKSDLSPSRR